VLGAYVQPETFEYEVIASNLLAGHGYTYVKDGAVYVASQSSPLYIYLTALVYALTGHSQSAMLAIQAIGGASTAGLAAWLGRRTFSVGAGWLTGAAVALDPGLVIYAAKLHSLTFDALVFVAIVCAAVALRRCPRPLQLAMYGALIGVAGLMRSTALVYLPVVLWWVGRYRAVAPSGLALLALTALLVVAPWSIRCSVLLGQPVLASSEATEWLWRGNNPSATGSSYTANGRPMLEAAPPDFRGRVLAGSEAERIGLYRDASLGFVQEQPTAAAALYLRKLAAFWWAGPSTGLLYPPDWLTGYVAWSAALLASAIMGALSLSPWERPAVRRVRAASGQRPGPHPGPLPEGEAVLLVGLVLVLTALTQSVFYVEGRHRLAVEPLLLVLSGGGLTSLTGSVTDTLNKARFARVERSGK
jgi:4-amino-4-deoxy-L-arabinose transferase-like glycosyltransferase